MVSRPLSARSIIASTLLGTTPPQLPSRLLVAFAAEFDVSEGATRVALSRMVERGELVVSDGSYSLCGALLDRQRRQAAGLAPVARPWRGQWEMVVIRPGRRSGSDRAALRQALAHLGLGERREGTWMRPDNLEPDRLTPDRLLVRAQADLFIAETAAEPASLVAALFDLGAWSDRARALIDQMHDLLPRLRHGDQSQLVPGFVTAAAVLRHLVADPLIPAEIAPTRWPAATLRDQYTSYDRAYRELLSSFFRRV